MTQYSKKSSPVIVQLPLGGRGRDGANAEGPVSDIYTVSKIYKHSFSPVKRGGKKKKKKKFNEAYDV